MTDTMTFDGMEFDSLLKSVLEERRAEAEADAGVEQRLLARLAQEDRALAYKPFGFAERLRAPRGSTATWFAVCAHALALLLIVALASRGHIMVTMPAKAIALTQFDVPVKPLPLTPRTSLSGGGGGHNDLAAVSQGRLPRSAQVQLLAPKLPPLAAAKLEVEPTVVMQKDLKMADNTLPNLGLPSSSLNGVSLGNGSGTGIGSGSGAGVGPGSGGNTGGGIFHVGGGVSRPVLLFEPEAEFSEEARKAKFSGNVEVYLWVDEKGHPSHIRVIHRAGLGLDEKAIEAVRQYRFKPAMKDGKPVPVDLYVDVNFQIL